jgi:hypothetical protein
MHDYLLETYHTHLAIPVFFSQNLADLGHCFVIKDESKAHVQIRFFKLNNCKNLH